MSTLDLNRLRLPEHVLDDIQAAFAATEQRLHSELDSLGGGTSVARLIQRAALAAALEVYTKHAYPQADAEALPRTPPNSGGQTVAGDPGPGAQTGSESGGVPKTGT
jgi:hypothetical protein